MKLQRGAIILFLATIIVGCLPKAETIDPSTILVWENYTSADGLAGNQVNSIITDHNGNLWIGTNEGVSKYDGKNFTNYRTQNGLINNFVSSIIEYEPGLMVFGTDAGVCVFDGLNWAVPDDLQGISFNVTSMAVDADGWGWVATDLYGLLLTDDGTNWYQVWDYDCFDCNFVNSIFLDANNTLWFATRNGLKSLKEGASSFQRYTVSNGLTDNYCQSIFEDNWGDLWVGTYNGLVRKEGTVFKEVNLYNSAPQNWVYTIIQDNTNQLWFSSIGNGLIYSDGSIMRTDQNSLGDKRISTISSCIDDSGTLWLGTYEGGLWKYNVNK